MISALATTATLALVVATPVLAETSSSSDRDDADVLEAIVVTALRREESIRDVPGTISAVTAKPRTVGLSATYSG